MALPAVRRDDIHGMTDYARIEDLYQIVPARIVEGTKTILNGASGPVYREALGKTRDYFKKKSIIMEILMDTPGSSRFTEIVYGIGPDEPEKILKPFLYRGRELTEIDEWSLNTLPCLGVKDRFSQVKKQLYENVIGGLNNGKKSFAIANFGCGLGRDTIEIIRDPEYGKHIKGFLIDTDKDVLRTSYELSRYYGIDDRVILVNKSMVELGKEFKEAFDDGLIVGILCSQPPQQCKFIVRRIYPTLKEDAPLTISNASKIMGNGNPVTGFREAALGWDLYYKDESDLDEIASTGGRFHTDKAFYDKYGQNVMIKCRKKQGN